MNGLRQLRDVLEQTVVLRFPRHRLSTFGDSEIAYHLVTPHPEGLPRATLRRGRVKALKPRLLTLDALAKHFEGFGEEGAGFERLLKDHFADSFHGLEYVFRNHLDSAEERLETVGSLSDSIRRDLEDRDAPREAVIRGPAWGWELSLMKFALEEAGRSFPVNVRELEERDMLDPAAAALRRPRREIELLFARAAREPEALKPLAATLKAHGLFNEYQDRFFSLVK